MIRKMVKRLDEAGDSIFYYLLFKGVKHTADFFNTLNSVSSSVNNNLYISQNWR